MEKTDLELILKIAAGAIGLYASVNQLINLKPTFRSSIKTDLEVLKMLEPSDPNYALVKKTVDAAIKEVYPSTTKPAQKVYDMTAQKIYDVTGRQIYDMKGFIFGILLLTGFSVWTYFLIKDGFSWWSLLTGFFALGGLGSILSAVEPKSEEPKKPDANPPNKNGD